MNLKVQKLTLIQNIFFGNKMNLKEIREIIDYPYWDDNMKRKAIIKIMALDKKAIPDILDILHAEREFTGELVSDLRLEVSRADCFIDTLPPTPKPKGKKEFKVETSGFSKEFVSNCIAEFFKKYKGHISHCFNKFND